MKSITLANSPASFALLDDWHAQFEARLPFATTTRRLETTSGFTDVLATGDDGTADGSTPVVVLHGAMAGASFALGELAELPGRRRFYAVNIAGQSTRAEPVRLDFRTDEYGRWLEEIFDRLDIAEAIVVAISWGASVALAMARYAPDRIAGLVLVVPASIVTGPVLPAVFGLALPLMRYRLFPTAVNRDRALARLVTTPEDRLWTPYLGDALRHWKIDFTAPPLAKPDDLKEFERPVAVVAADRDLSFPGRKVLDRSAALFPNLIGTHLLNNSFHCPSTRPDDRAELAGRIEEFLDEMSAGRHGREIKSARP
ncbi:MAG: alpha/beta fold hydrolase [Planctomycetota bacterium]